MKSSRLIAFEILLKVFKDNAYSNLTLDKALSDCEDKAFTSSLVYGVIERKITLDFLIEKYLESNPKIKVKIILYLGAYQLYFMEKVPSRAAINETVKLADEVGCSYYKSLINAVLHKIDNERIEFYTLELKYSVPEHLINMWKKMYGEKNTLKILDSVNEKPPVFAIPNALFLDADELLYELNSEDVSGEIIDNAVMITSPFDLRKSCIFNRGLFHIQDLSSYMCAKALNPKEKETVIDVCSAPGGKAFTMAEMMKNSGTVYALDLYEHRVKLIEQGAERLCLKNIKTEVNDALIFNKELPIADKVLCDVPCSGFGIIRRKPEIRYKDLDEIKELPEIQYNILKTSSKYLKKGGMLLYSTCTLNKRENEKVVERFLENGGFKLIDMKTIFPERNGGDGFFWALTEKTDD